MISLRVPKPHSSGTRERQVLCVYERARCLVNAKEKTGRGKYLLLFHTIHIAFQQDIRWTNKFSDKWRIWNSWGDCLLANDDDV